MITIYGATGYTGRMISRFLAAQRVEHRIAGRTRARLERVRDDIALAGHRPPEVVIAPLDDRNALEKLAQTSKVILSCAGPFREMGPPVIDACLKGGAHYLDITGEQRFMVTTALRDAEAKAAGVVLVNAVGFDVVPSDLVVHLAAAKLGGRIDRVDLGMCVKDAKPSGGTFRTMFGIVGEPGLIYRDGGWREQPLAAERRTFVFPELGEREVYSAPIGDSATGPRTSGALEVHTYMALPKLLGRCLPKTSSLATALVASPLGRAMKSRAAAVGEGPDETERGRTRFAFVAEARGANGVAQASIYGRDPYGITVETAALIARACDEPSYELSGSLSPMQAVSPEVWRALLERWGCRLDVTTVS